MLSVSVLSPASSTVSGQYVEVRTCDIWTAPCFANAEINLAGKNALLAWKIEKGAFGQVDLTGLGVAAVIAATDTLGIAQTGAARSVLIVDSKANAAQRAALAALARHQAGDLVGNVIAIHAAPFELTLGQCQGGACARMKAGSLAYLDTRCLDTQHDKACGNEGAYYPPLVKDAKVRAAVAVEHGFNGKEFNQTWKECDRRGAYVGSFEVH
jgi:hypothetical protein